jgi:hypothetical protein
MMRRSIVGLAAVCGLILAVAWFSRAPVGAQEKPNPAAQKWEYKVVLPAILDDPRENQDQLNKLGAEGWDLCAARVGGGPSYFILKRPKR